MAKKFSILALVVIAFFASSSWGSSYEEGLEAYQAKQFDQAKDLWEPAAKSGDTAAQYGLGILYLNGYGVVKDLKIAYQWFERSADGGLDLARIQLGIMYATGAGVVRNLNTAIEWLAPAAERENPQAQFPLAGVFEELGDFQMAINWYQKAAIQGHNGAAYNLGLILATGMYESHGISRDAARGMKWLEKAANGGNPQAAFWVGEAYFYGYGDVVPQDYSLAVKHLKAASNQKLAEAQYLLGWMYYEGKGLQKDFGEAFNLMTRAADQNLSGAQERLGAMYENGHGVVQNLEKAYQSYLKAAQQGDPIAKYHAANLIGRSEVSEHNGQKKLEFLEDARISGEIPRGFAENSLGFLYLKGAPGVAIDYQKARYWGIEGGKKGAPNAYSNVALQYFAGLGVPQDFDIMVSYLIKAVEVFEDEDDWILQDEDTWLDYRHMGPKHFWDAYGVYQKYVLFKDKKYLDQLKHFLE